ncbi:MAG: type II toxin-antitoxin system prevent-host-death family antitoxin [Spirochaetes bacterium]|nr:type II toxin-antitoxin system prevent-host-death family antitoxin [Spirochaetota bacterium]
MKKVTIHEAKTHLSRLIRNALAGEEVIIARGSKPLVKLMVIEESSVKRKLGTAAGKIRFAKDFNEPLDEFKDYLL